MAVSKTQSRENGVSGPKLALIGLSLAAAVLGFLRWADMRENWKLGPGSIVDTRIVAEHGTGPNQGGELIWRAEYKVAYSVAGHEYTVWSDSGIRGESEDEIRLALSGQHPSCRVRYDPSRPDSSAADCH